MKILGRSMEPLVAQPLDQPLDDYLAPGPWLSART